MSLLVTGSIGIDTVESPAGKIVDALGGSAVYFAYAASFFGEVRMVGVVGEDCPHGFLKPLEKNKQIDMAGIEVRPGSRTFRWHGRYHDDDVNERDTMDVELNVLGERGPAIPESFRDSRYVFLANTHPELQLELLGQLERPEFVVADTMDLWITTTRDTLVKLLGRIDGVVLNDSEAKLLTDEPNVVTAGREIAQMVQQFVVVKKGEHGSLLFVGDRVCALPSYPSVNVIDPTGAGDSYAGGMLGYIAAAGCTDAAALRQAIAYGTVTASLTVEDFSLRKLTRVKRADIDVRLDEFRDMTGF